MKKEIIMERYPLYSVELLKTDLALKTLDEVAYYFKKQVDADGVATFIALFDHYVHTASLDTGEVDASIKGAKNVLFCFGQKLLEPKVLGVRPRSIGIAEKEQSFVISFLEAPMMPLNEKMIGWVKALQSAKE